MFKNSAKSQKLLKNMFDDTKAVAGMSPYKNLLRHDGSATEELLFVFVCVRAREPTTYVFKSEQIWVLLCVFNMFIYSLDLGLSGPCVCVSVCCSLLNA